MGRIIIAAIALIAMAGCKTKTKVVEVPRVQTEYITRCDTVKERDSVYVYESVRIEQKGDTVFEYRDRWRDRWRDRYINRTDTFVRVDSVAYPVVVEKAREDDSNSNVSVVWVLVAFVSGGGVYSLIRWVKTR